MKKHFLPIVLLIVILFCSCNDDNIVIKKCNEYFNARVDSIFAPDTVLVNDTLRIHLSGYLGPSGCYSFHKFVTTLFQNNLSIWVWGLENWCTGCIQIPACFCEVYKVTLHNTGVFYINIHQPDGSILKDSVYVK